MPFKLNFVRLFCYYISNLNTYRKKEKSFVRGGGLLLHILVAETGLDRHAGPIGHADLGTSCFHVILGTGERKREKQAS